MVEVLTESWTLLSDCQVHVEISSQLIGYLFYFINASLFNSLMERGISKEKVLQVVATLSISIPNSSTQDVWFKSNPNNYRQQLPKM